MLYLVVVLEVLELVDFFGEDFFGEDFFGEDFFDKDKDFFGEDKDFFGEDFDVFFLRYIFFNFIFFEL